MSTEVVKELNTAERAHLARQAQHIAEVPWPQLDVESGNQFVFVAHFDGTRNDRDNLELSGSPFPTNVARLDELMAPHAEENENYVTYYEPGVGTNPDNWPITRTLKAGIAPSGDMHAAAESAYEEFSYRADQWLKNHPDAEPAEALKVIATGFSRGGGTAAIFSQLLYERGLKDPSNDKILVAPGVLGLSGGMIFDPVTTGYGGNDRFSPTSRNILVVRAEHEYRAPFKGVDYGDNPHINIVQVMGNHCDIGGGYDQGISAQVLENSRELMSRSGLPLDPIGDEMRYRDDEPVQIHHEHRPIIFPPTHKHTPQQAVETGEPRQLETPSARTRKLTDRNGWHGFNGTGNTIIWSKDYPEAAPDAGGIRRAISVEGRNRRPEVYLTHHDGQIAHYQLHTRGKPARQNVDRLSEQELVPGQADISIGRVRPKHIVPSRRDGLDGSNAGQSHLTHSEQQTLERLEREKSAATPLTGVHKPEHASTASPPEAAPAQHHDPKQRQAAMAEAFKKDPVGAVKLYSELEVAQQTLETIRAKAGHRAAAAMHKYLSRRIELDKTIPTPQQGMKMLQNALDQGR